MKERVGWAKRSVPTVNLGLSGVVGRASARQTTPSDAAVGMNPDLRETILEHLVTLNAERG